MIDDFAKAQEAAQIFSDQFGPDDIYKSILFDVFLEELIKKESNGDQTNKDMDVPNETR